MMNSNRNLFVLFNTELLDEKAVEKEVRCLKTVLRYIETPEQFCIATELVDRNRINSNKKRILKESNHFRLRPFRFLINKN
ncbi:MAG: hypothetical protein IPP02_11160 [Chitinophagaceae bacterium]|jgi:hypothetical protein|nr:hypothetical protein [Chitinophagaceae bacterium]MBK7677854.1 hypothetical protein [Chitinophagaceae bacterium]MBK8300334.1 hypothetical protein [Chitinophagaceae bacterium]MBK9464373.1 hypothetical protein [Chitinophagaceae bacterium]MBK9658501.1 hypothetical protein [Chitinophagaceae bacterium]